MKRILNKIIRDLKYKRSRVLNRGIEPTYLNYKITDLCNLKCKFCNIWKTQRENPELIKKELRAEDIEKILTINSDYFRNLRFIQITGGEPFLKGDLVQIVSIFSKFIPKLEFWFATNGFLPNIIFNKTEEILSQTNNEQQIGIGISLDGTESTHDSLRGRKDAHKNALETVKRLKKIKTERLKLAFSYTLTPNNKKDLEYVIQKCKDYDINFTYRPLNTSAVYYKNLNIDINYEKCFLEETRKIIAGSQPQKRKGLLNTLVHRIYLEKSIEFIQQHGRRTFPCFSGFFSFFLNPQGEVFPCISMDKCLGNIREKPFREIWNNKKSIEARQNIKRLRCIHCWVECEAFKDIKLNNTYLIKEILKEILWRKRF